MYVEPLNTPQPARPSWTVRSGSLFAGVLVLGLLGSVVLPMAPIFIGVFLVLATAVYASLPALRPHLRPILRTIVGGAGAGQASMLAFTGVLLVASGSMGARLRGHWRSEWVQSNQRGAFADDILVRAEECLTKNDVQGAEFALIEAEKNADLAPEHRARAAAMLERIHSSGDPVAILDILVGLPQAEFDAFEQGTAVPRALEYEERILTRRAVWIAHGQIEEARSRRASGSEGPAN